ncbi:hypothetical protein GCM10028804_44150 [Larkinella terrae]
MRRVNGQPEAYFLWENTILTKNKHTLSVKSTNYFSTACLSMYWNVEKFGIVQKGTIIRPVIDGGKFTFQKTII